MLGLSQILYWRAINTLKFFYIIYLLSALSKMRMINSHGSSLYDSSKEAKIIFELMIEVSAFPKLS